MIDYPGIVFAVVVAGGGIAGYIKASSIPSLVAGLIFGVLIAIAAFLFSKYPNMFYFGLINSLALACIMGWRYYITNWNFMPAGLIFMISIAMVFWYSAMAYVVMNN